MLTSNNKALKMEKPELLFSLCPETATKHSVNSYCISDLVPRKHPQGIINISQLCQQKGMY